MGCTPRGATPRSRPTSRTPSTCRHTSSRGSACGTTLSRRTRARRRPPAEGVTHFARTLGAVRSGDTAAARREILVLAQIESTLTAKGGAQVYWAGQLAIQQLAASAWLELAAGDTALAVLHASEAADREDRTQKHPVTPGAVLPAPELEGDLLLVVGTPAGAGEASAV